MVADGNGGLWLGTDSGLMYLPRGGACDGGGGDFSIFDDQNSPLPHNRVVSAARNFVDGSLWFGTAEGLLRVDPVIFTGMAPPPDKFVLYPNPLDLSPMNTRSLDSRKVILGIDVGGAGVIPAPGESVSQQPIVFDLTGQEVGRFDRDPDSGGWSWWGKIHATNAARTRLSAAPGVYLVRVQTESGEVMVLKIGVIR
jgi:hypothetical protein